MRIGIDGNEANVEKKVGISEYAYQLLQQFYKRQDIDFTIYLKDRPRADMPREREGWHYILVGPKKLWTQVGLPLYLFTHFPRPQVFFSPTHYAPRFASMPTAISIMDVSYLHFPQLFASKDLYQLKEWTKYSAKNAKKIFTISTFSKNDILKEYKKTATDVVVTYPGIKAKRVMYKELDREALAKKFGIGKHYVLFVGTLQPRKNIERLIEAFSMLVQDKTSPFYTRGSDLELVIVGKKGWLYDSILAAPSKFDVTGRVKFLEFVGDEDLPFLYKHAQLFVLPSLYEGFGLPVVEAMRYGCPVVTSNVSSLPEAGGDAAVYVDPENVSDIAEKLHMVLNDREIRKKMVTKGYEQIKKFSWEKAAEKTLEVLTSLAK